MLLQALHVDIEMKSLNLQVTLLVQNGVCVWECRSHPTAPLLASLMLIRNLHSLQLI